MAAAAAGSPGENKPEGEGEKGEKKPPVDPTKDPKFSRENLGYYTVPNLRYLGPRNPRIPYNLPRKLHKHWSPRLTHRMPLQPRSDAGEPTGFDKDLERAVISGDIEVCRQRLEMKLAHPDQRDNLHWSREAGKTSLHWAAQLGRTSIVQMLVKHNAQLDPVALCGAFENTPLMLAAEFGHPKVVQILLDLGADATKSNGCFNALQLAKASEPRDETVAAQKDLEETIQILTKYTPS